MHRTPATPFSKTAAMTLRRSLPALAFALALAGCAEMPELGPRAPISEGATPALLPMDQLAAMTRPGRIESGTGDDLAARALRLQARAHAMRGPVLDPATRARLARAAGG